MLLLLIFAGNNTFIGLLRFVMSPKMVRRRVLDFTGSTTFSRVSSSSAAVLTGDTSSASNEHESKRFAPTKGVVDVIHELVGDIPKLLHKLRLLASTVRRFKLSHTEALVLPDEPRWVTFRQSNKQSSSAEALGDVAAHAAAQAALAWAAMAACAAKIWAALGEQGGMSQAPGGKNGDAPAPKAWEGDLP